MYCHHDGWMAFPKIHRTVAATQSGSFECFFDRRIAVTFLRLLNAIPRWNLWVMCVLFWWSSLALSNDSTRAGVSELLIIYDTPCFNRRILFALTFIYWGKDIRVLCLLNSFSTHPGHFRKIWMVYWILRKSCTVLASMALFLAGSLHVLHSMAFGWCTYLFKWLSCS